MDAPLDLPKPGELIAGKYEIVRPLGRGGMGAVFEAKHLRLQQRVAIKFLKPDLLDVADCVMRFEREGRAAALVTSSNAARIFDVDVTPSGIPYMVIELLEGHDLSVELRERTTLPVGESVDIILQACSAMAEAHGLGIVHRDLKPANLFLCVKGSNRTVKVLDFGVSKLLAEELQSTTPSLTLGTPQYMSPEQILASKDVDLQSDIWSLGVILYKLISGRLPYEAESATAFVVTVVTEEPLPIEQHTAVPPDLAAAIMKALAKQRGQRWLNVMSFARAIEPYGTGHVAFTPPTLRPPAPPSAPRLPDGAVDVDFETRQLTQQAPSEPALPTQANWTSNGPPRGARKGRIVVALAALAALGLAGAGLALAMRGPPSAPGGARTPQASADTSALGVPSLASASAAPSGSVPAAAVASAAAPGPSTTDTPSSTPSVEPTRAPAAGVSAAAPRKPPPVAPPATSQKSSPSPTPTPPARPRDPVHL